MCQICGAKNHTGSEHGSTHQGFNLERFMNAPRSDEVPPSSLPEVTDVADGNQGNSADMDDFALWEMELDHSSTSSTADNANTDTVDMSEVSAILDSENVGNETMGEVGVSQKVTDKVRKVTNAAVQGGKQVSTAAAKKAGSGSAKVSKKVAKHTSRSLLSAMRRHKIITAFVVLLLLLIVFDGAPFIASLVSLAVPFVALAAFFYGVKRFIFNKI